ncbi:hypothetical protein K491DRAFT_683203 [Lophiostoma macrostomum CBS 122681]|uniref:Uncharacterized protein n=1 Tax=Lophiostoma macrostomum CBS 122681 TaxID=1314788 RepID=A0A6A6SRP2_9PLEO|nr:hypothetical protein K491DRAFT_683203 [Lophiostoma macrostomum CBS 122681]
MVGCSFTDHAYCNLFPTELRGSEADYFGDVSKALDSYPSTLPSQIRFPKMQVTHESARTLSFPSTSAVTACCRFSNTDTPVDECLLGMKQTASTFARLISTAPSYPCVLRFPIPTGQFSNSCDIIAAKGTLINVVFPMPAKGKRPADQPTTQTEAKRQRRAADPAREDAINKALYARRERETQDIETIITSMTGEECKRIMRAEAQRDAKFAHCILTYFDKSRGNYVLVVPSVADFLRGARFPLIPPTVAEDASKYFSRFFDRFLRFSMFDDYHKSPFESMHAIEECGAPAWYFPACINSRSPAQIKFNALAALRVMGKVMWEMYVVSPLVPLGPQPCKWTLQQIQKGCEDVTNLLTVSERIAFVRRYGSRREFTSYDRHVPGDFRALGAPEWESFMSSEAIKARRTGKSAGSRRSQEFMLEDDNFVRDDVDYQAEVEQLPVIKQEAYPDDISAIFLEQDKRNNERRQEADSEESNDSEEESEGEHQVNEYYWCQIEETRFGPNLCTRPYCSYCPVREYRAIGVSQAMKDACKEVFGSHPA